MTGRAPIVPIERLVGGLTDRVDDVIDRLGLRGRREGREFVAFNPLRVDNRLGSFRICLDGAKRGVWADFALQGVGGDALDLVAYIACGDDKKKAVAWARHFLGYDSGAAPAPVRGSAGRKREQDHERKTYQGAALKLWLEGQESLRGTPAAAYLAGRGIDLARLGRQPRALRFHPSLNNRESGRAWPALLAGIVNPAGKMVAVHRTWLAAAPDGSVAKAPIKDTKMTLGAYRGGCIRLWRGMAMDPDTGELTRAPAWKDMKRGETVAITEGIEDGLTVAIAKPAWRVLVAVSLANMAAIELPPEVATVVLCADNDAPDSPAGAALRKAIDSYAGQGRRVKLARSSVGKDFNDRLRGAG